MMEPISPHTDTAQTLERLRKENGAQESVLRGLRADLLPRSFSSRGSMRVAPGPSIAYFHIESARQWNREFQTLCAAPLSTNDINGVLAKVNAINNFLSTFEAAMLVIARKFLDQYLGESESDMALESVPISNGITIALLDCEDRSHISIAAKEQAAQYRLLSQQIAFCREPVVHVSPRIVVSWKGRLMVISADIIAISEPYTMDECFEHRLVMDLASETLNLKRYNSSGGDGSEELKCSGPSNATVVRGEDGRLYAHNIQALYPYFPPAKGNTIDAGKHKVHLRPELVSFSKDIAVPLSPAAFVTFGATDSSECNSEVRDATAYMCQHRVPCLVSSFLQSPPDSQQALIERLHNAGINVACLAITFFNAIAMRGKDAKGSKLLGTRLVTEMCARAMRDVIQQDMSHKIESTEVLESVGEVLAHFASNINGYITESLLPMLKVKFVGLASLLAADKNAMSTLFDHVDATMLVSRTMELLGVSLKPFGSVLPTDPSAFAVEGIVPVVKRSRLPVPCLDKEPLDRLNEKGRDVKRGLASRPEALRCATPNAAQDYLRDRKDELTQRGLFAELSTPQHSSSYIYACYDMASLLNSKVGPSPGGYPTNIDAFVLGEGFRGLLTPSRDVLPLAKEAVAIATIGIQCMRDSPITNGTPGVVLLRAMLKYERAVARTALLTSDGQQFVEATADLQRAFKLLAPMVHLHGETIPPALQSTTRPESLSGIATPRTPPAGTLPSPVVRTSSETGGSSLANSNKAPSPPIQYSLLAIDVAILWAAMIASRDLHEEAFPPLQYAANACKTLFGEIDPRTVSVTAALATNCMARGDLTFAEQHLRDTIAAIDANSEKGQVSSSSEELSHLMTSLANILDRKAGMNTTGSSASLGAESDALHKRNIEAVTKANGPNHPSLAVAYNNYAASLIRRNKLAESDAQLNSAIAILRKVHGTKPAPEVAETLNNIATLRRHQKRMEEAKATWLEALSIYEAVSPMSTHDLKLIPILENLAAWCREMSEDAEQDTFVKRVDAVKRANGLS